VDDVGYSMLTFSATYTQLETRVAVNEVSQAAACDYDASQHNTALYPHSQRPASVMLIYTYRCRQLALTDCG